VHLPTWPDQIQVLESVLAGIVKKIEALPLKEIAADLHQAIIELNTTLAGARGTLTNTDKLLNSADRILAPNSVLDAELGSMLQEVGGAARAMRLLSDYLERHPEALIRGKTGEAK
jgi:paraquat-inducible protein B